MSDVPLFDDGTSNNPVLSDRVSDDSVSGDRVPDDSVSGDRVPDDSVSGDRVSDAFWGTQTAVQRRFWGRGALSGIPSGTRIGAGGLILNRGPFATFRRLLGRRLSH